MVNETNGLSDLGVTPDQWSTHLREMEDTPVYWTEPGLKVTRLRLLSDPGFPYWDVSYCHGTIGDRVVRVDLPFSQLKRESKWQRKSIQRQIVEYAIRDGVYAKGLGILDNISTLI